TASVLRTARVVNKGGVDVTYDLSYAALTDAPGVTYTFPDGPTVTVPAGGSTTFEIQLDANAAAMKHLRDATMAATQGANPRYWMSEESGNVILTPASGTSLRLPVWAAPRPASNMSTNHNYVLLTGPTGSTNVGLTGQDVNTGGAFPVDVLSLVSAFELQGTSPANVLSTSVASNADLKSVGVTSDFKATNSVVAGTRIFFAVAMHGKWTTPSDVQVNIFIDRDMNGTDDFQVSNLSTADAQGNAFDVFVSARRSAPFTGSFALDSFLNNIAPSGLETVVYNTNMMVIPVMASQIGLTTANAKFNYRITTNSRGFGGTIDSMTTRTYDAANPGFDVTGGLPGLPVYADLNGGSVPVNYNKANLTANGTTGLLLLHHNNGLGLHDQILSLQEPTATTVTVDAASGVYSDATTLKATVSPATYLDQTISGNVQFSVDGNPVGAAVAVNSSGVATTSYTVDVGAGAHTITAAFTSTNSAFLNSSNTGTLTVSKEDATVTPDNANPSAVKVNSPGGTGGPITLCFNMDEVSDGSPGDTTKITSVTVNVTPIGGGASASPTAVLSGGGVGATRTACVTLNNVPVNVYDVTLTINGNFYQGTGSTVLVVYDPSLGFVAGGGHIIHNGYRANIGVNIKYLKNGNAQGSLLYIEHRPTGDVIVKSNALGALAIVGNEAKPTGKAVVNGVGNHSFIARIIDNGEPGVNDKFGLRVTSPGGAILVDLTFDPITLSGGNFSVPKLTGK
ncbi:MAG TPA: Ig-like domain-containing protein, partial [Pyrinomonadaceae bacterium]